jgi:hypothetical protein
MPFFKVVYKTRADDDSKMWHLAQHLNEGGALMFFNTAHARPEGLGLFTFEEDDNSPADYYLVEQERLDSMGLQDLRRFPLYTLA